MCIVVCSIANEMGYCHKHQDASEKRQLSPFIHTTTGAHLPQRRKPVSQLARTFGFIRRRKDTRRSAIVSSVSAVGCSARRITYPSLCSLSFAFCQPFQRSSSLKLASRQLSFPCSSGLDPKWSLSRHEDEEDDFCAAAVLGAVDDVSVAGLLSESVSLEVFICTML